MLRLYCEKKRKDIKSYDCAFFDPKMCPNFKGCDMDVLEKAKERLSEHSKDAIKDPSIH